jgi:coproporphyrinogen III oxidase
MERSEIEYALRNLQDDICSGLERLDGQARFHEDLWDRPEGGGGRTRIINRGNLIEKGGVNFSAVHGPLPEVIQREFGTGPAEFFASGVSIVLHPNSPMVPIIHMNVRYFEISNGTWWFGGGIDLTPHYIDASMAGRFHQHLRDVCNRFHPDWYAEFKTWADDYFYINHRKETRGIGGIFFDKLGPERGSKEFLLDYIIAVGQTFVPAYSEQTLNRHLPYTDQQKQFQLLRRGRYVEFNLVYDRGTKFGLQTDGRIESILMSLPVLASWEYNPQFALGSPEQFTLEHLRKGVHW